MCIRNIYRMALTDRAVEWCEQFGMPIMAKDFLGYMIRVTKNENCLVGLDNLIIPVSSNPKHPNMTKKRAARVFKVLTNSGFIKYQNSDPFPEMERYNHMNIDLNRAFRIDNEILGRTNDVEIDDDIEGIEEYVGNLFSWFLVDFSYPM